MLPLDDTRGRREDPESIVAFFRLGCLAKLKKRAEELRPGIVCRVRQHLRRSKVSRGVEVTDCCPHIAAQSPPQRR